MLNLRISFVGVFHYPWNFGPAIVHLTYTQSQLKRAKLTHTQRIFSCQGLGLGIRLKVGELESGAGIKGQGLGGWRLTIKQN